MSDGHLSQDRQHLSRMQRQRRARMRRVDYYPNPQALAVIEAKRAQHRPRSAAATNSALIDAIVIEWATLTGIKYSEIERPMTPELLRTSRMRAPAYESDQGRAARPEIADHSARARMTSVPWQRVTCGAKRHRDGQPCQAKSEPGKRRCRFHGGRSTGPRTAEGKARALANLRQNR